MSWLKTLLGGTVLLLLLAIAAVFWLLRTESGATFAWNRSVAAMGGDLTGEWAGGSLAGGFEIRNLRLRAGDADLAIETSQAAVTIELFPLAARISDARFRAVTLVLAASESQSEVDIEALLQGLQLPLLLDVRRVRIDDVALQSGTADPFRLQSIDASFSWFQSIDLAGLSLSKDGDAVTASGRIDLLAPQSGSLAIEGNYKAVQFDADIALDTEALTVSRLAVSSDEIDAGATASLRWSDGLRGDGHIDIARLAPASFTDAWPASRLLHGQMDFELTDASLRLSDGQVRIRNSDMAVDFDADVDTQSTAVSASLTWRNIAWPLDAETAAVTSRDGALTLAGKLDDWRLAGSVSVATPDVPAGQFNIEGGGDRDHLAVKILEGRVFGGSIAGEAAYRWQDSASWSLLADITDLRTAGIAPAFPGVLSGHVSASGTQDPPALSVELRDVSGVILGDALTAAGSIQWSQQQARAEQLSIRHGNSSVTLNGSADTAEGMAFTADIAAGSYMDEVAGRIAARGRFSRLVEHPFLSLDLESEQLVIADAQLSGVRILDRRSSGDVAAFAIEVDALRLAGQDLADLELVTRIRKDRQQLAVRGTSSGAGFEFDLEGAFEAWSLSKLSPWRGELESFVLDLDDEHSLRQQAPAPLELSSARVAVSGVCLVDGRDARVCLDAARRSDGFIDLRAELNYLPVAIIEHLVDTNVRFDQLISGTLSWRGNPSLAATGKGDLSLTPGLLQSSDRPAIVVPTGDSRLRFEIVDGDFLTGTASLPLPGIGGIEAGFEVPALSVLGESEVTGFLNIDVDDIDVLALFVNVADTVSGKFDADLSISGQLSKPLLTGGFTLQDATLDYLPIGLKLVDVDLAGELTETRAVEVAGSFGAGQGRGEIISSAEYLENEQAGVRFRIRGEDLVLVDIPDVQLRANPDIDIAYQKGALDINGSLLIPSARVTPSSLAETRVSESEDVVIVAGQRPQDPVKEQTKSKLTYGGSLRIDLGDDVIIDLDVARAALKGGAIFRWQGGPMPVVDGRYALSGEINALGQNLRIAEGAILYAGVPANAPYLRIRAEREIFGNSQVKRAGVLLEGVASRPTLEAYTDPMTTEERALTLLVTGSDFNYEQGVGAVDFGTYIAPRLFVSYGIGIFDRENIISARYDLTKGFGIKATSGEKQSGVDLNYRFEN